WRRAVIVLELRRADRHHRLLLVGGGKWTVEAFEPALLHPTKVFFVELHRSTEQFGDRLLGEIVGRRSQSAGRDDGAAAIECVADGTLNRLWRVTDGCASNDLHPDGRERSRQMRGVGVDGEAEKQLVADGDDLHRCAVLPVLRSHFWGTVEKTLPKLRRYTTSEKIVSATATIIASHPTVPLNMANARQRSPSHAFASLSATAKNQQ